jgi:hypothetical protein
MTTGTRSENWTLFWKSINLNANISFHGIYSQVISVQTNVAELQMKKVVGVQPGLEQMT